MRIIGLDPSSTYCGSAVIDSPNTIIKVEHWERDKNKSHPDGFKSYFIWLGKRLYEYKPHMAVIEMGAWRMGGGGKGNTQALQAVSFYQAISALCCKLNGLIVIETRATSARKASLGRGDLSKEEVWEIMRKKHPDLFSPKTRGGLDECDALVLAESGPTVAER